MYVPIINQHRRIHLMYYDSLLAAVLQTDFVSLKEDRLLCSSFSFTKIITTGMDNGVKLLFM